MTDQQKINEIAARHAAATPGPHEIEYNNDTGPNDEGFWKWLSIGPYKIEGTGDTDNVNAVFAAYAWSDIQYLLAALADAEYRAIAEQRADAAEERERACKLAQNFAYLVRMGMMTNDKTIEAATKLEAKLSELESRRRRTPCDGR